MAGRLEVRRRRRAENRKFRLKKPVWLDPYPGIPGTEPEKRLFEALMRRRIYFVFQGDLPEYKDFKKLPTLFVPAFKPDFVLPEYRVILDPFGVFHHSLPEAVKRDAIKSVVYRSLGYAFYHPWWDDRGFLLEDNGVFRRVGFDALAVLDQISELRLGVRAKLTDPADIAAKVHPGYRLGKNLGAGAGSVALANKKRTKPKRLTLKPSGRRRRTSRRSL